MNETWAQIKALQVGGDPQVFVFAAKDYIENAFFRLLTSRGAKVDGIQNTLTAVEANFDSLPSSFKSHKHSVLELLSQLRDLDRPLDWYDGEFVDHKKIAAEQEANFNLVLHLLQEASVT